MSLKVYNSLSRQKEIFTPINAPYVGMYVCGPTVSGESHLGHARPFITFDVIYRYLMYLGYKVRYVRNITDAGHFEEEGREAEDNQRSSSPLPCPLTVPSTPGSRLCRPSGCRQCHRPVVEVASPVLSDHAPRPPQRCMRPTTHPHKQISPGPRRRRHAKTQQQPRTTHQTPPQCCWDQLLATSANIVNVDTQLTHRRPSIFRPSPRRYASFISASTSNWMKP